MYELINNTPLPVREYDGQRVVTFRDIDNVHQRPDGTAGRNFRTNRRHFIEGVDFFTIDQPDEIRRLGFERPQGGTPELIVLVTLSGYLMIAKSFTDELSWSVQRMLVSYFIAREPDNSIAVMMQRINELESRLNQLESRPQIPCKPAKKKSDSESDTEIAFYVLEKLYSFGTQTVLKRELTRKCRKINTARVNRSLELLEEWGYISRWKQKTVRRPAEIVGIKHQ